MSSALEVRAFLPIDLPLVHRLAPSGISFDSATTLTRGVHTVENAVWGAVPLADLGTPTFVLRDGDSGYVAQFRHKTGEQHAHLAFIAPNVDQCGDEDAWLRLLDAMAGAAGRRGAQTLNAEVSETSGAFVVLRQAGFAVYARQEIWRREPGPFTGSVRDLLRPCVELDAIALNALYASVVPRLVRQADPPPEVRHNGLVYERDGRIAAYITAQEGKNGIYMQAIMHPDMCLNRAQDILAAALSRLPRLDKLPVYFNARRYQAWLSSPLEALGFSPYISQAVMVRHTTRRVEQVVYRPVNAVEGVTLALPRTKEYSCLLEERN